MKPVPPEVPTAPSWTRSSLWSAARCLEHSGTSWWHIGPRRPVRIFLLTELGNHVEAPQKEPAIGGARQQLVSSWKLRAVPHGPGLFTLPFWQASSATLKPIHPGMPGPHPCPPHRPLSSLASSSSLPLPPLLFLQPPSLLPPLPKRWEGKAGPRKDSDFQF